MPAWLEIKGSRFPLNGSCAIGRLPENQVVLNGDRVSRRHALVHERNGGGHWLIDFGSSNGSLLNGRRILEPTRLRDKDRIEIAGHLITFRETRHGSKPDLAAASKAWKTTRRDAQAFAATNHGAILLDENGKIATITPQAQQWVAAYFEPVADKELPEKLRKWIKQAAGPTRDDTATEPTGDIIVALGEHKRLVVHLAERNSRQPLLLLTEEQSVFSVEMLRTLGLTERESEVMRWIAEGKSNPEIGVILDMSFRTVGKHVEHIFSKLGVESRTAAMLQVMEALGKL
jgi:DNA-binding CsgD family transcriptional regulator